MTRQAAQLLSQRNADAIEHPGGTLLRHLERTADLLELWEASPATVSAGLWHAAYGTDGFDVALFSLEERDLLRQVIGVDAESHVYCYAACDRRFTYAAAMRGEFAYRDRLTGEQPDLPADVRRAFVDITFANEIDLYDHSPEFRTTLWPKLTPVFAGLEHSASPAALAAYQERCALDG